MSAWTIEQIADAIDVWARTFSDWLISNEVLTGGDRDGIEQLRVALVARSAGGVAGERTPVSGVVSARAPAVSPPRVRRCAGTPTNHVPLIELMTVLFRPLGASLKASYADRSAVMGREAAT